MASWTLVPLRGPQRPSMRPRAPAGCLLYAIEAIRLVQARLTGPPHSGQHAAMHTTRCAKCMLLYLSGSEGARVLGQVHMRELSPACTATTAVAAAARHLTRGTVLGRCSPAVRDCRP